MRTEWHVPSGVLINHRGRWLELWLQCCGSEFGLGLWASVLDGCHVSVFGLLGPFNWSLDLWLPNSAEPVEAQS